MTKKTLQPSVSRSDQSPSDNCHINIRMMNDTLALARIGGTSGRRHEVILWSHPSGGVSRGVNNLINGEYRKLGLRPRNHA